MDSERAAAGLASLAAGCARRGGAAHIACSWAANKVAFARESGRRGRVLPERPDSGRQAVVKIENVLFATDFSEDSGYALTYARGLAELSNTKLFILHVIENPLEHLYGVPQG